ncbi:early endosome antigen 1 [Eurytemora carolleeae]|uniref:early endosome antigen 1 n=1 Tax=Eurytemora carolleeae TaxID=1294199 RepID=UPI000C756BBA|nr:early endosome antigen 1 [Eurytemora carolleeae]|eukprot:XP_023330721.1 early endosome antigen 1-like [Eurytemora affinis]
MKLFLKAEKNTLADALRESEAEVRRLRGELSGREDVVRRLEEQNSLLVRRAEQRSQELQSARSELTSLKERAREMLLAQGAELSRASLAVSQIYSKLDLYFPGSQCEMEDDEENSSSDSRSEGLELGLELGLEKGRRSSQFLVTPTENLDTLSDFSRAMMSASTGSDTLGDNGTSISSLALAIADRKHSESHGQIGAEHVPSLADQVYQLDLVISKILSTQQQSSTTHQEIPRPNLNLEETRFQGENLENLNLEETKTIILEQNKALAQLRNMMESREESQQEMKNKFIKNREILTSNWEQAEEEVRKIDEIYHQTVNRVINTLKDLPEIVDSNPNLGNLMRTLLQDDALNSADGVNGNLGVGKTRKSDNALTRSLADETPSNTFQNSRNMSQSLFLDGLVPVGMRTGVFSEPCLAKSPLGSVPSILSSPRIQEEDLNANQSL